MTAEVEAEVAISPARRNLVIAGLMLGMALPAIDLLIVATAASDISADLGELGDFAWLFIGYQLTLVLAMLVFGKLGDLYGRRRVFQAALAVFVAASMLAGASTSFVVLVLARMLQGFGGGAIMSLTQGVLADITTPRERGRFAWVTPSVWAASSFLGPLLGGVLVDTVGWRWIFFLNLPFGLASAVCFGAAYHVPHDRREHRIDLAGAVLFVAALVPLMLALTWAGDRHPWGSPLIIAFLVGGGVAAVAFVVVERRAPEPLVPLHLFAHHVIRIATATHFFVGTSNFIVALFLPLAVQVVAGGSATDGGLALMPISVMITLVATVVGRSVARTGRYRLYPAAGNAAMVVGMLLLATIGPDSTRWEIWSATAVVGIGLGAGSAVLNLSIQNVAPYRDVGVATSVGQFSRTLGQVIGPAIANTLILRSFDRNLGAGLGPDQRDQIDVAAIRDDVSELDELAPELADAATEAFRAAFQLGFRLAAAFAAVACVIALFLPHVPLRSTIRD